MVSIILFEFLFFLAAIGGILYLIPSGVFYIFFHNKKSIDSNKIQPEIPSKKDIKREVILSLSTIFIFSICATLMYQLVKGGYTLFYYDWSSYSTGYHFLSFFLCLLFHDTYFYWAHRLMHWKPLFKHFHIGHHRSRVPTPWAALAFQPLEALVQFGTFAIVVLIVPIHPIVFTIYIIFDSIANTAAHNGFELVPKWISKIPILKLGNTVTHHEIHHQDFNSNYGAFYNIWDRIMGTFRDDTPIKSSNQGH